MDRGAEAPLNEIYVKHTGQDYDTIHNAMERDRFMSVDQALEFGLIDKVITSRDAMETAGAEMISCRSGSPVDMTHF